MGGAISPSIYCFFISFALLPGFYRIRGSLGSLTILHINFGLLASYTAGNYLPYYLIPKIMLCLPIAFLALVCLLPETPYCLLREGKFVEAEKSLMFYRNIPDVTRKTLAFDYEFESMKACALSENSKEKLTLADFSKCTLNLIVKQKLLTHYLYSYTCSHQGAFHFHFRDGSEPIQWHLCHSHLRW